MFRVFDVIENIYSDKDFFIDKDGKLYVRAMYFNHEPATRATVTTEEVDPSRYLVEDSTGLTDKNDKMIFDGDIDLEYGVVKWSDNYGGWFCFKDGEERPLYDYPLFEVVGTIHDNPELEVTQ